MGEWRHSSIYWMKLYTSATLTQAKKPPGKNWIKGWMGPRTVWKRKRREK
jgi:hypothetical protein